jgi:hypothetical protein
LSYHLRGHAIVCHYQRSSLPIQRAPLAFTQKLINLAPAVRGLIIRVSACGNLTPTPSQLRTRIQAPSIDTLPRSELSTIQNNCGYDTQIEIGGMETHLRIDGTVTACGAPGWTVVAHPDLSSWPCSWRQRSLNDIRWVPPRNKTRAWRMGIVAGKYHSHGRRPPPLLLGTCWE